MVVGDETVTKSHVFAAFVDAMSQWQLALKTGATERELSELSAICITRAEEYGPLLVEFARKLDQRRGDYWTGVDPFKGDLGVTLGTRLSEA